MRARRISATGDASQSREAGWANFLSRPDGGIVRDGEVVVDCECETKSTGQRTMENEALLLDLVEWIAAGPRAYTDVLEAWRTSCPRLTI